MAALTAADFRPALALGRALRDLDPQPSATPAVVVLVQSPGGEIRMTVELSEAGAAKALRLLEVDRPAAPVRLRLVDGGA